MYALASVALVFLSAQPAFAGRGLPAAQKAITGPIAVFTIIAATAGILKGAIQMRKGFNSEGISTIAGSCICLFVISLLYAIASFIGEH